MSGSILSSGSCPSLFLPFRSLCSRSFTLGLFLIWQLLHSHTCTESVCLPSVRLLRTDTVMDTKSNFVFCGCGWGSKGWEGFGSAWPGPITIHERRGGSRKPHRNCTFDIPPQSLLSAFFLVLLCCSDLFICYIKESLDHKCMRVGTCRHMCVSKH